MRPRYNATRIRLWVLGCLTGLIPIVLVAPSRAMADSARACADAYEKAQEERKAGHLTAAIEQLTTCSAQDCPGFVRKDCLDWMTAAENAQPSIVFSVRRDGADLTAVEIWIDGSLLAKAIDGKALAMDPGFHVFRFRPLGGPTVEKSLIVREGEQNRLVEIDVSGGAPPEGASPEGTSLVSAGSRIEASVGTRPATQGNPTVSRADTAWLTYGLAGVGALGISGFAAFGLWGYSQKQDLDRTCSPFCQSSQVDQVSTKYIVADVCLAVGLVSLGLATYRFVSERRASTKVSGPRAAAAVVPTTSGRGAAVGIVSPF